MFKADNHFMPLIKMMNEAIEKRANILLKEYDVTSGQIRILVVLSTIENNECTLKNLEKIFSFSQAAIAAVAVRLEQKGFVESHAGEDDKRIKYIRLTEKGKEIAELSKIKLHDMENKLFADFTEEEREQLFYLLRKMHKKLIE